MRKEATNTFNGGMIKDFHPLTTPNNVLTDALNGTFITYNGNEKILQNDMGNAEIKHALLKAGYVPVGMKEHGGIVYVAAYNPQTGKGQVGSFPSPKQLWESENWTVNSPSSILTNISFDPNFYNGNYIINEIVKRELFLNQDGEGRIFHPGDKFIIGISQNLHNLLNTYINSDYLDIQLGVIKSDGSIEVMRTWSKEEDDDFFYVGAASGELLKNKQVTKVFDASSSGQLILILNLHTLDSFNLVRKYSLTQDNKIKVTFTGEAQKNGTVITSTKDPFIKLTKDSSYDNNSIDITGTSGVVNTTIYPNVPFGIVQRMGRNVRIDFDKIRKNQDDFGEWRFFVTEEYVKIGWAYDFYNLDGSKEIDYIRMYFHKLEDGYNRESAKYVDFQKEVYSGNFEDYVKFSDIGLMYKRIYMVEVVKKFKGSNEEIPITIKMLYLSKFFNKDYNGFFVNNAIGNVNNTQTAQRVEFDSPLQQSINLELKTDIKSNIDESIAYIKGPADSNFREGKNTGYLQQDDFVALVQDLPEGTSTAEKANTFVTKIENNYGANITIKGNLANVNEDIIGRPNKKLITRLLNSYSISSISVESDKEWQQSTSLATFPTIDEPTLQNPTVGSLSVNDDTLTLSNITFKDYRFIQGLSSGVQTTPYKSFGLQPIYSPKYTTDVKNTIAPYWNRESQRVIAGAGEDGLFYNSSFSVTGDVIEGPDGGGGPDDGGLKTCANLMGKPMTNIFVGAHGLEGRIYFKGLGVDRTIQSGMRYPNSGEWDEGQELDDGDNFAIACWKFTDGETRLVNLVTSKSAPVDSTSRWPRVDVMLRCILSQLFTVRQVNKVMEYITTNKDFYRYQTGITRIKLSLAQNSSSSLNSQLEDIMCSEDDETETTLTQHFNSKWGNVVTNGEHIKNLIPKVKLTKPTLEEIEIEIPDSFDLDAILSNYLGINYTKATEQSSYDVKEIYCIDTSSSTYNASVCAKGSLKANLDGAYEWTSPPKCKSLSQLSGTATLYRWNSSSETISFPGFGSHFTTRAKLEDWTTIQEDEDNEILAQVKTGDSETRQGVWNRKIDEAAPDIFYKTLYSPQISLLRS